MQPTLSNSLFFLLTGVRAIAQEIKDLSPESAARNNILHYSKSDLYELEELSDAIHCFDQLARGILDAIPQDQLNCIVTTGLNKLQTNHLSKLNKTSAFSKATISHRVACIQPDKKNQAIGVYRNFLLEKTTFEREIQPLAFNQWWGNYTYEKRNLVGLEREKRTVYTMEPKVYQDPSNNREDCLYLLKEGLGMLVDYTETRNKNIEHNDNCSKRDQLLTAPLEYDCFAKELAGLLLAISNIATEIRMYSSYAGYTSAGYCDFLPVSSLQETHDLANVILIASEILDTLRKEHHDPQGVLYNKAKGLISHLSLYCEFNQSNVFAYSHIEQRGMHTIKNYSELEEIPLNSITTLYEHSVDENLLPPLLKKVIEHTKIGMEKTECLRDTTHKIHKEYTRIYLVKSLIEALEKFAQKFPEMKVA